VEKADFGKALLARLFGNGIGIYSFINEINILDT
jgi:hypothetical protein